MVHRVLNFDKLGLVDDAVNFGFRRVPTGDKASLVHEVFDSVAPRYDVMNDLMSGGIHRLWKTTLIDALDPRPGMHLVDVAGGTGDIAFRILRRQSRARAGIASSYGPVFVCDVNQHMLQIGRNRALDLGVVAEIAWLCGDAEDLPLASLSVDAYSIAFGLRNVTNIDKALREARRVLKPGGRFLCLEFSRVVLPLLGEIYDRYSFLALPALGRIVAGDTDSYRYLAESIRRFPGQEELTSLMSAAGFEQVKHRNLTGGIAALHSAWRL